MEKAKTLALEILETIVKYACVAFFTLEKYFKEEIQPHIHRMKPHCWAGVVGLLILGWLLAKIF